MAVRPFIAKAYDNKPTESLAYDVASRGASLHKENYNRTRRLHPDRSFEKRLALPGYLDEMASQPWAWSTVDCTQCIGTWIERIIGINPLAKYRGTYHTPDEAKLTAKLAGGFLPALGELFDAAGLERTQDYEDGDIAAVNAGLHERAILPVVGCILAIRSGELWIVKAARGIVGRDFPIIHGWRL